MHFASKSSGLRREPNSHEAAEPRNQACRAAEGALDNAIQKLGTVWGSSPWKHGQRQSRVLHQSRPQCLAAVVVMKVSSLAAPPSKDLCPWATTGWAALKSSNAKVIFPLAFRAEAWHSSSHHANQCVQPRAVLPNPSLKRSANGMVHWPSSAGPSAHFALAVQRATPSSPA